MSSSILDMVEKLVRNMCIALATVAQLVEHHCMNQKVTSLIPGQGTGLGGSLDPSRGTCKRQPIEVFLTH